MSITTNPAGRTGQPTELARYTIPTGERIILGQRVYGSVILVDVPAGPDGRVYLIERHLEQDGNAAMHALIDDYVSVAQASCRVPAARVPLDRYLDALA